MRAIEVGRFKRLLWLVLQLSSWNIIDFYISNTNIWLMSRREYVRRLDLVDTTTSLSSLQPLNSWTVRHEQMRIISHGSQRRPKLHFPSINLSYFTAFFRFGRIFSYTEYSFIRVTRSFAFSPSNFRQNLTSRGHSSLSSESLNRSEHFSYSISHAFA